MLHVILVQNGLPHFGFDLGLSLTGHCSALGISIFKDIEMGLESGLGILAGQLWGHATQRFKANHSLLMSPLRPLRSQNISIDVVRFLGNYQTRSNSNGFSWKKSKHVF